MLTISDLIKYLVEGLAVSLATYIVAGQKSSLKEMCLLGLTAGTTFLILDLFTSGVGDSARQGSGFGLGAGMVGWGGSPLVTEGFVDVDAKVPNYRNMDVGVDADGQTIGYDPETATYGRRQSTNQVPDQGELASPPYRFPSGHCPRQPAPVQDTERRSAEASRDSSPTCTKSRWMGWVEDDHPINDNTEDYKVVPGLYSKYIVRPGYNEHLKTGNVNQVDQLSPTVWPTNNPLDRRYFKQRELELMQKKTTC